MNPVTTLTASASAAVLLGKLGGNHLKRPPQAPGVDKTNPFIGYFHKGGTAPPPPSSHRLHHAAPRPKPATKQYNAHARFADYLVSSTPKARPYAPPTRLTRSPSAVDLPFRAPPVDLAIAKAPLTTLPNMAARFATDFTPVRVLGQGGQGCVTEVTRASDPAQHFAIKRVSVTGKEGREKARLLTQSLREVHLMANLPRHPNIVRYYTAWLEEEATPAPAHRAVVLDADEDGADEDEDDEEEVSVVSEEFLSYDNASACGFEFESADDMFASVEAAPAAASPTTGPAATTVNMFIQMELCQHVVGRETISNLAAWLRSTGDDRVSTAAGHAVAMQLFTDVVRGVKHIHAYGVIHRDIKPENVFLQHGVAKIGDFGLSKHMYEAADPDALITSSPASSPTSSSSSDAANHTTALGTFLYASPEQVGRGPADAKASVYSEKSDIFALGVMLLELCSSFATIMERVQVLTAVRHGVVPAPAQQAFPAEMALVSKMTASDPRDRPSADEIFNVLSPIWGGVLTSLTKTWSSPSLQLEYCA